MNRSTQARTEAQRAISALDDARARLAAVLRDPTATEAQIAEAVARARGRVLHWEQRRRGRSEEASYGHE
jgi:hypothetical protein